MTGKRLFISWYELLLLAADIGSVVIVALTLLLLFQMVMIPVLIYDRFTA